MCYSAIQACSGDVDCDMWLDCTGECLQNDYSDTCWDACDKLTPDPTLHQNLQDCVCTPCNTECGSPLCK
jgi:hypothetical protein